MKNIVLLLLLITPTLLRADGVCKGTKMPFGYVPVAEFDSPECGYKTPFEKNAWELKPVAEGVITCEKPDYLTVDAKVLDYVAISATHSDQCPSKSDGTSNAFKLYQPWCASPGPQFMALEAGDTIADGDFAISKWHLCKGTPMPTKMMFRHIDFDDPPTPICELPALPPDTVVVRRYHSTNCSADTDDDLNGWVIVRHKYSCITPRFTCDLKSDKPPFSHHVYKPECGGPEGQPNSHVFQRCLS